MATEFYNLLLTCFVKKRLHVLICHIPGPIYIFAKKSPASQSKVVQQMTQINFVHMFMKVACAHMASHVLSRYQSKISLHTMSHFNQQIKHRWKLGKMKKKGNRNHASFEMEPESYLS